MITAANVSSYKGPSVAGAITYATLNLAPPPKPTGGPNACSGVVAAALAMKGVSYDSTVPVPNPVFNASTKFSQAALTSAITQTWPADESTITGGLAHVQMTVDDQAHWQVTWAGIPIMDSDTSPSWPACLNVDFA